MLLYNFVLRFCSPIGIVFLLLLAALVLRKRKAGTVCLSLAILVLFVGGNHWVAHRLARSLEWRHLPNGPLPEAQAIVLASGGLVPQRYPRPTVECGDAGDRVIYTAYLYKNRKAPLILCTGGFVPGTTSETSYADDTITFLKMLGVPGSAIDSEAKSRNTYENAMFVLPLLKERKINRLLLVTSARHMPRALAVFKKACPEIEVIPAPTDFGEVEFKIQPPFLKLIGGMVPSAGNLMLLTDVLHEYIGMAYYKLRGWM